MLACPPSLILHCTFCRFCATCAFDGDDRQCCLHAGLLMTLTWTANLEYQKNCKPSSGQALHCGMMLLLQDSWFPIRLSLFLYIALRPLDLLLLFSNFPHGGAKARAGLHDAKELQVVTRQGGHCGQGGRAVRKLLNTMCNCKRYISIHQSH
jgi:hypothetical protein